MKSKTRISYHIDFNVEAFNEETQKILDNAAAQIAALVFKHTRVKPRNNYDEF